MRTFDGWLGRAVIVAGLVGMVAGCSPDAPGQGDAPGLTPPSVGPAPQLDSVRGLTLPSEGYQPSSEQQKIVDVATDRLIADCMGRFGFTWEVRDFDRQPVVQMARMYGIGDPDRAQTYGYHFLPNEEAGQSVRKQRQAAANGPQLPSDPNFSLVLSGSPDGVSPLKDPGTYGGQKVPVGGCAAEALRELGVENLDPTQLAGTIGATTFTASETDTRVVEVVAAWSACMKQKGYTYASPADAAGGWDLDAPPTAQEIQTAVDDVMCKQQTNLIGVWYTIQVAYENQLIQEHILELDEVRKQWADATARATQVLGSSK